MKTPTPLQIRTLRTQAGISQAELARLLDVSRQTIINYENGHTNMRAIVFAYMRHALAQRSTGT